MKKNNYPIAKKEWFEHLTKEGGIFIDGFLDKYFIIFYNNTTGVSQDQ